MDKLTSIGNQILDSMKDAASSKINTLGNNMVEILKFLVIGKGMIQIGLGIVVGFIIMQMNVLVVEGLLSPIISRVIENKTNNLEDYRMVVMGVDFPVGKIIVDLLKIIIVGGMVYGIYTMDIKF